MKNKKIINCILAGIMIFPLFGAGGKSYSEKRNNIPNYIIVDDDIISNYEKKIPNTNSAQHTPLYTGAEYAASVGMGEAVKVEMTPPQKMSNDILQTESQSESKSEENKENVEKSEKQETSEVQKTSEIQEPQVRYKLTDEERSLIEHIVMSESGNTEPYEGQALIAQCLLDACELDNISPFEAAYLYQYAAGTQEPNESVKTAVSNVFDKGELITPEPVVFYYNPDLTQSRWHESQVFVIQVGRHRFFKKRQ